MCLCFLFLSFRLFNLLVLLNVPLSLLFFWVPFLNLTAVLNTCECKVENKLTGLFWPSFQISWACNRFILMWFRKIRWKFCFFMPSTSWSGAKIENSWKCLEHFEFFSKILGNFPKSFQLEDAWNFFLSLKLSSGFGAWTILMSCDVFGFFLVNRPALLRIYSKIRITFSFP